MRGVKKTLVSLVQLHWFWLIFFPLWAQQSNRSAMLNWQRALHKKWNSCSGSHFSSRLLNISPHSVFQQGHWVPSYLSLVVPKSIWGQKASFGAKNGRQHLSFGATWTRCCMQQSLLYLSHMYSNNDLSSTGCLCTDCVQLLYQKE